jgi:flagellar hook-length control protein FliK
MPLLNALLAKMPVTPATDAVASAEPGAAFSSLMPMTSEISATPTLPQAAAPAPAATRPTLPPAVSSAMPPAMSPDGQPAAAAAPRPEVATKSETPALPQVAQQLRAGPALEAAAAKPLKIAAPAATAEPVATESEASESTVVATPTDPQQMLLGALMAAAGMPANAPAQQAARPAGRSEPSLPVQASSVAQERAAIALPRGEDPAARPLLAGLRQDFVVDAHKATFEMPLQAANQELAGVTVQVAPQALLHAADPAANNVQFTTRPTSEAPPLHVPVPAGEPGFGAAVGEGLAVLIKEGHHRAELRLDPPDLGTVSVQIDLKGDRASLSFVAPSEAARDALAQALPDLRNALASQGLSLTHTNIGSESRPQAQANPEQRGGDANGNDPRAADGESAPRLIRRGLVDEYA